MAESATRNILAMVTLDEGLLAKSNVATFVADNKEEQEKIASELGRVLGGNIYGLSNGVVIITQA